MSEIEEVDAYEKVETRLFQQQTNDFYDAVMAEVLLKMKKSMEDKGVPSIEITRKLEQIEQVWKMKLSMITGTDRVEDDMVNFKESFPEDRTKKGRAAKDKKRAEQKLAATKAKQAAAVEATASSSSSSSGAATPATVQPGALSMGYSNGQISAPPGSPNRSANIPSTDGPGDEYDDDKEDDEDQDDGPTKKKVKIDSNDPYGDIDDDDLSLSEDEAAATTNQVLCQYADVRRNKTRWKCRVLGGIMRVFDKYELVFLDGNADLRWD